VRRSASSLKLFGFGGGEPWSWRGPFKKKERCASRASVNLKEFPSAKTLPPPEKKLSKDALGDAKRQKGKKTGPQGGEEGGLETKQQVGGWLPARREKNSANYFSQSSAA